MFPIGLITSGSDLLISTRKVSLFDAYVKSLVRTFLIMCTTVGKKANISNCAKHFPEVPVCIPRVVVVAAAALTLLSGRLYFG